MEELKRMLKVIHKENKDIIKLLCFDTDDNRTKDAFREISNTVDKKYDDLFYGIEEMR